MKKINLSIFASGSGSNFLAIHYASQDKNYPAKINLVICNKPCPAYTKAKKLNYKTILMLSKNMHEFEKKINPYLLSYKIDLICLAGFMRILTPKFVSRWKNKILNIHPSILPLFPGLKTHEKVLKNQMKIHGSTVHLVNQKLDSGEILGQFAFKIQNRDINDVKAKIKKYENILYPEVVNKYVWTFIYKKDNLGKYELSNNNREVIFSY